MIPPRPARGVHARRVGFVRIAPRRPMVVGLVALVTGLVVFGWAPAAHAVPADDASPGVTLTVDALTPRVVTSDGPPDLVVSGRVVNRSSAAVRDLQVRVQRGAAVSGARDTTAALGGDGSAATVRVGATMISGTLAAGRDAPFTLRIPLRGGAGTSMDLSEPGVYPIVIDLAGGSGRLAGTRMLLPVIGVPGSSPEPPPPPGRAAQVSVVYPIADRPRRLPVVPGATPLLADDDLATSFAPGGRLAGLVDALGRSAPLGSPAAGAVCLAVDADLLETATTMTGGYQVQTPEGPVPGRGAATAGAWLGALKAQAQGRCVIALPYADTDVVATSRGNLPDLTTTARVRGAERVAALLGASPAPDTTVPADGDLDDRSLTDLAAGGARTLLVNASSLTLGIPPGGVARLTGAPGAFPTGVALDPVATTAMAGSDASAGVTRPAGTDAPLSVQDALGVLVLRATTSVSSRQSPPVSVVAPPTRWAASATEAGAYLDAVSDLSRRGLVRPIDAASLARSRVDDPALATSGLRSTAAGSDADTALSETTLDRARAVRDRQRDLVAATEQDRTGTATPADFLGSLTDSLMRSLSATWRGDPDGENGALRAVEGQTQDLRSMVAVVQPSGAYTLGSNDAPLPLTVENRLPVAVRVRVVIAPTQGLRATPPAQDTVPAFGSRQFPVGIQVVRSGQFSVDAQARTPGGEPLGPTARLLLRSTAYGTITVWLTASAAVVLVILASVRIARRIRASRGQSRPHVPDPRTNPPQQMHPTDPSTVRVGHRGTDEPRNR